MAQHFCKKCKATFQGETCPRGHANFMYTRNIPEGATPLAEEGIPPPHSEPEAPSPRAAQHGGQAPQFIPKRSEVEDQKKSLRVVLPGEGVKLTFAPQAVKIGGSGNRVTGAAFGRRQHTCCWRRGRTRPRKTIGGTPPLTVQKEAKPRVASGCWRRRCRGIP